MNLIIDAEVDADAAHETAEAKLVQAREAKATCEHELGVAQNNVAVAKDEVVVRKAEHRQAVEAVEQRNVVRRRAAKLVAELEEQLQPYTSYLNLTLTLTIS